MRERGKSPPTQTTHPASRLTPWAFISRTPNSSSHIILLDFQHQLINTTNTLTLTPSNKQQKDNMSSSKDDVLQFLDSLDGDSNTAPNAGAEQSGAAASRDRTASASSASGVTGAGAPAGGADNQDEQSVLDFLDEITQSASTPVDTTKATPPGSQGKSSFYDPAAALPSKYLQQQQQGAPQQQQQQQHQAQVDSRSSWLGSLWSTASEAVKNTQTVVQSSVKATMESQATKNLEERVKGFVNAENIGKIGMFSSLCCSAVDSFASCIASVQSHGRTFCCCC
jgi:hypothetical protein